MTRQIIAYALLLFQITFGSLALAQQPMPNTSVHRQIQATATVTASSPLGQNDSRKYLQVQNQDATLILWACGGCTAVASGGSVVINPGQTWAPYSPPTGAISIISNGTNSNVGITEGR